MKYISQISVMTRWSDWGPGKVTILCSLGFYIAVAYHISFSSFLAPFTFFVVFASAQAALGYMVNNWGDRELDRMEGKPNPFNSISYRIGLFWIVSMVFLAFITAIPFINSPTFIVLWVIWLFSMTAYSLKPMRLKTRGFWGLLFSFCAQWSLPVLIAFSVFDNYGGIDMWIFAIALTISGGTLEVAHQRHDREKDLMSDAITFGAGINLHKLNRIYAVCIIADKFAILSISFLVVIAIFSFGYWWSNILSIFTIISVLLLFLFSLPEAIRAFYTEDIQDPYYSTSAISFGKRLHETVPNFILPMMLVIALSFNSWYFLSIFMFFIFWRVFLGKANWKFIFNYIFSANPQA